MRRLSTLAALVVLGAALIVSVAFGQQGALGQDGKKDYNGQNVKIGFWQTDSTVKTVGGPSNIGLPTTETAKDRDYLLSSTVHSLADSTGILSADSSAIFASGNVSRMWMSVRVVWPAKAGYAAADTSRDNSTFPNRVRFTIGIMASGSAAYDTTTIYPWSMKQDTIPVGINAVALLDSTMYIYRNNFGVINQLSVMRNEYVFEAAYSTQAPSGKHGQLWGEKTAFWVPLCDYRGVFYWAPNTYVRLRFLNADNPVARGFANNWNYQALPTVEIKVYGTPLR